MRGLVRALLLVQQFAYLPATGADISAGAEHAEGLVSRGGSQGQQRTPGLRLAPGLTNSRSLEEGGR